MNDISYHKPKLVFKRAASNPLAVDYGNAYYPGCFTPTGVNENESYPEMINWCKKHNVEIDDYLSYRLLFKSEQDVLWFMLHWS